MVGHQVCSWVYSKEVDISKNPTAFCGWFGAFSVSRVLLNQADDWASLLEFSRAEERSETRNLLQMILKCRGFSVSEIQLCWPQRKKFPNAFVSATIKHEFQCY